MFSSSLLPSKLLALGLGFGFIESTGSDETSRFQGETKERAEAKQGSDHE